jgi:tRNA (Thr-GGU) A37 N-methylase
MATPRQGRLDGPLRRSEILESWVAALDGLEGRYEGIKVLYWLHPMRRNRVRQSPANDGITRGTFSLRTAVRPNPIATSIVAFVSIEGPMLLVRGVDCLSGTPLPDFKPDRTTDGPAPGG